MRYSYEFKRKCVEMYYQGKYPNTPEGIGEQSNKHRYGVRRVHQELINRGYKVNHKRVQRLMHEANTYKTIHKYAV